MEVAAVIGWSLLLVVAVLAADRGAEAVAEPFKKLRAAFGLSGAAGGALVAIVTAGPEVGINTAAAARGSLEVGLGNMLGANIVSIPLIFCIAYIATKWFHRKDPSRPTRLRLDEETLGVQGLPYLGVLALVAVTAFISKGLEPIDGVIMLAAFVAFYLQAILRKRGPPRKTKWTRAEILKGLAGAGAVAVGAFFAVLATEGLVEELGIPPLFGGLFVSSTMSVAPEALKTWVLVRIGETTAGTTSVVADNVVTMTVGFFPLALAGAQIRDLTLFSVNLGAAAVFAVGFCVAARLARSDHGVPGALVIGLGVLYLAWAGIIVALASG